MEVMLGLIQLVFGLLAMLLEFAFLALTQGLKPASEKFQQRQETRREAVAANKERGNRKADAGSAPDDPTSGWGTLVCAGMLLITVVATVVGFAVSRHVRAKRIAETELQIESLADQFVEQVMDENAADPEEGLLAHRDAWRQPIELQVDKVLLGTLLVVRSCGPDRKPGTIDDQLAIRTVAAPAKQIGGELAKRGFDEVREKVKGWLPGKDEEDERRNEGNGN